jgi:hypothetical protein
MELELKLAGGGWANLREADQIPRRQARAFRKVLYHLAAATGIEPDPNQDPNTAALEAGKALLASDSGLDEIEDMAEALALAAVDTWSYGEVTADVLATIPDAAVNQIFDACQEGGYLEKLMPDFGVSPDEDSPTTPS